MKRAEERGELVWETEKGVNGDESIPNVPRRDGRWCSKGIKEGSPWVIGIIV